MNETQPWDKHPDESSRAYAAFVAYRDLGPERSIDKAHRAQWSANPQNGGKTAPKTAPRHWTKWSSDYRWVERTALYDQFVDAQVLQTYQSKLTAAREKLLADEMRDYEEQINKWREIWGVTVLHQARRTKRMEQDAAGDKREVEVIFGELNIDSFFAMTRWRVKISDFGRRALGMPDTITQVNWKQEFLQAGLNPDELEKLLAEQLKRDLASGAPGLDDLSPGAGEG